MRRFPITTKHAELVKPISAALLADTNTTSVDTPAHFAHPHQSSNKDFSSSFKDDKSNFWRSALYCASAFAFFTALTLPEKDSFVRERFDTKTKYNPNQPLLSQAEQAARWSIILWTTGVAGLLSKYETSFKLQQRLVELYLEFMFAAVFEKNNKEKQRVFFRGETEKEAREVLQNNRGPLFFSLISGEFSFPYVGDSTLHAHKKDNKSGYTTGVISCTTDWETTGNFGKGEAVLVFVPERVAHVSHHCTKKNEGNEFEAMTGGIDHKTIIGVVYNEASDPEIRASNPEKCKPRFELNRNFEGDLTKLALDKQMLPWIHLLPDSEPCKKTLLEAVGSDICYQDSYTRHLSEDEAAHKENYHRRMAEIANNGFSGSRCLQRLFRCTIPSTMHVDSDLDTALKIEF